MGIFRDIKNTVLPSTIDDFKATVGKHGGLARTARFAVIITPPTQTLLNLDLGGIALSALSGTFGLGDLVNDPRDIALLCESCSLPGRQITTTEYASLQDWWVSAIPTGYLTEDVTFSFHLTHDYYIKKMFDKWQASIINQSNFTLAYESEYYSDVIIQQLDQNNLPIYGVKLRNAFPTGVNSITLDNNSVDQTQKLSVTFKYEDFETQGGIKSLISGVRNQVTNSLRRII
jgi:hypothetical protein